MIILDLGACCADCFAALNYNPAEMPFAEARQAMYAGQMLSTLCDREGAHTMSTGAYQGFSLGICDGCGSSLGGDRWKLLALQEQRRDIGR